MHFHTQIKRNTIWHKYLEADADGGLEMYLARGTVPFESEEKRDVINDFSMLGKDLMIDERKKEVDYNFVTNIINHVQWYVLAIVSLFFVGIAIHRWLKKKRHRERNLSTEQ